MRYNWPMKFFKGTMNEYVFVSSDSEGKPYVVDYDSKYSDNTQLIELIGRIIYQETRDNDFAWKLVRILAERLGVNGKLRDKDLSMKEYLDEFNKKVGDDSND